MAEFITAVHKVTRRKRSIPAHWLENVVLGRDWELPPSARADQDAAGEPPVVDITDQTQPDPIDQPTDASPGEPDTTPAPGDHQED